MIKHFLKSYLKYRYTSLIALFVFLFLDKTKKQRIISFLSFSYFIVVLTKGLFAIPHPDYPNTFRMPSGHTYMEMSLFGVFFIEVFNTRKKFMYLAQLVVGFLEGYRCVYFGFHIWVDVLVAIAMCFVQFVIFYEVLFSKIRSTTLLQVGIFFNCLTILILVHKCPNYLYGNLREIAIIILLSSFLLMAENFNFKKFKLFLKRKP